MSIPMDAMCFQCHLRRNLDTARQFGDEKKATAFAKELMQLYLRLPEESSSPELGPWVNDLFKNHYGLEADRMRKEKESSNAFVLQRLPISRPWWKARQTRCTQHCSLRCWGTTWILRHCRGKSVFPTWIPC